MDHITPLLQRNLPNVNKKIFADYLPYSSFKKCLEVSKTWRETLERDVINNSAARHALKDRQTSFLWMHPEHHVVQPLEELAGSRVPIMGTVTNGKLVAAARKPEGKVMRFDERGNLERSIVGEPELYKLVQVYASGSRVVLQLSALTGPLTLRTFDLETFEEILPRMSYATARRIDSDLRIAFETNNDIKVVCKLPDSNHLSLRSVLYDGDLGEYAIDLCNIGITQDYVITKSYQDLTKTARSYKVLDKRAGNLLREIQFPVCYEKSPVFFPSNHYAWSYCRDGCSETECIHLYSMINGSLFKTIQNQPDEIATSETFLVRQMTRPSFDLEVINMATRDDTWTISLKHNRDPRYRLWYDVTIIRDRLLLVCTPKFMYKRYSGRWGFWLWDLWDRECPGVEILTLSYHMPTVLAINDRSLAFLGPDFFILYLKDDDLEE